MDKFYLELALAIAQYFYYGGDNDPIMPDHVYDEIEKKYQELGGKLWVGNATEIEKLLSRFSERKQS